MARWLRKAADGRILAWTPQLAKRKDMIEISPESASERLKNMKAQLDLKLAAGKATKEDTKGEAESLRAISREIAQIEAKLGNVDVADTSATHEKQEPSPDPDKPGLSAEQQAEIDRMKALGEDKEYQSILAMKAKPEIAEYAKKFGLTLDMRESLEKMRYAAKKAREAELFGEK